MQNPSSIEELFASLATRLIHFESKAYLTEGTVFYHAGEAYLSTNKPKIVTELHKSYSLFNPKEVADQATTYLQLIHRAKDNLQPVEKLTYDYSEYDLPTEVKEATDSQKKKFHNFFEKELDEYIVCLESIGSICQQKLSAESTVYNPDNVTPAIAKAKIQRKLIADTIGTQLEPSIFHALVTLKDQNDLSLLRYETKEEEIYNTKTLKNIADGNAKKGEKPLVFQWEVIPVCYILHRIAAYHTNMNLEALEETQLITIAKKKEIIHFNAGNSSSYISRWLDDNKKSTRYKKIIDETFQKHTIPI